MIEGQTIVFKSFSGTFIREDRILQAMPNVVLALHVLTELNNPESYWQPYLCILYYENYSVDFDIKLNFFAAEISVRLKL